jgi:hypothetical protein
MLRMIRRNPALAPLLIALGLLIAYSFTVFAASFAGSLVSPNLQVVPSCDASLGEGVETDPASQCPNLVELNLVPKRIDIYDSALLDLTLGVYPSGIYGGSVANGALASKSLSVQGDSVGQNSWRIPSNTLTGGKTVSLALENERPYQTFPFDSYVTSWTSLVEDSVLAERVVTTGTVASAVIPGFDMDFSRTDFEADVTLPGDLVVNERGRFGIQVLITRSMTTILETGLLLLAVLVGAVAALYMTARIQQGKRPPSLAALGWLATLLFALIEVRRALPTDPPLGIYMDRWLFLPVMILLLGLIVVVAVEWIRRPEWDSQNRTENSSLEST